MAKNCIHQGGPSGVMPWTNTTGSDVAAGTVVVAKHTLVVTLVAVKNGAVGSVAVEGVFTVPKVAGNAWAQGEKLIFDVDSGSGAFENSAATPATGDVTGGAIAWVAAASGDITGIVKLTPGNTTVT